VGIDVEKAVVKGRAEILVGREGILIAELLGGAPVQAGPDSVS